MPRVKPHAKIHTTIRHHDKTAELFQDNDLLAAYLRLMLLAVERFASRTGDTFTISRQELPGAMGTKRIDSAEKILEQLTSTSPVLVKYLPSNEEVLGKYSTSTYQVHIPNFTKKQGFPTQKGAGKSAPDTDTDTDTNTHPSGVAHAPPKSPEVSGFVSMLTGEIPTGPNGETWANPGAWFEDHREILIGEAQLKSEQPDGQEFQAAFRSLLMRFWRNKHPEARRGKGARPPIKTPGVSSAWKHNLRDQLVGGAK